MEHLSRIQHVVVQSRSSRVIVVFECDTREIFTGKIIFMSMFNDISWGSKDNKIESESNVQLFSL